MFGLKSIVTQSPAKVILFGEYSVLYGGAGMGSSINVYQTTYIGPKTDINSVFSQNPKKGMHSINKCDFFFTEFLKIIDLFFGIKPDLKDFYIVTESNILRRSGLGSSSAYTVSLLKAFLDFFDIKYCDKNFIKCARHIENLYHGKSSGMDVSLSYLGGALLFKRTKKGLMIKKISTSLDDLTFVFTGRPEAKTKDCVSYVQNNFSASEKIWGDFQNVADILIQNPFDKKAISQNHKLLCRIGVVPSLVQKFISDIEAINGVAKICGAGSIRGKNAGVVWVSHTKSEALMHLCSKKEYRGYKILSFKKDENGTRILKKD
jgi:mevalonate kinase